MVRSKLPNSVLRRIWNLSDIDEDGMLDRDEFAVAMFLIDHKLSGNDIPDVLPDRLVPPSKVKRYSVGPREEEGRGRCGDREEYVTHSNDFGGGNSHEAYAADSGYERDASYRVETGYRGGGGRGRDRGRQTDDYDDDSTHLSSFIDRGQ